MQFSKASTREAWLHITAISMFLISSLLLARFIYIYPISPAFDWAQASDSFLLIIIVAAMAFFAYMTLTWSFSLTLILFLISSVVSSLAEHMGLSTGLTFGSLYSYHPDIAPRITEQLPLVIPFAWFIFCCIPLILLRPWLIPASGQNNGKPAAVQRGMMVKQVIACSLLLTSFDLYLEPISVYTGYWTWAQQGLYYGTPVMNFLGWFWVGLLVFSCFFYIQNRWFKDAADISHHLDRLLIGLIIFWIVVALALIGYRFSSLKPLWLSVLMIGPFLYLRVWKERQVRETILRSGSKRDGTG